MRLRFCSAPSNAILSLRRLTTIVNMSRMRGRRRILSEGGTTRYSDTGRSWLTKSSIVKSLADVFLGYERVAVESERRFRRRRTPPKSRSSLSSISWTFSRTTG